MSQLSTLTPEQHESIVKRLAETSPTSQRVVHEQEPVYPPFEYASMLEGKTFGDWRDDLVNKGYAVIPAIEKDKALAIRDKALSWVEDFGLGFKRDDPTTWKADMMPADVRGGMLHSYGIGYEDWVWEAGAAPGVVEAYTKLWGTSELVKSIDTASIMMPGRLQPADIKRWPHADHAPARRGVYCIQGLVNLNDNGPEDGGLMLLEGSAKLFESYFDSYGRTETRHGGFPDIYPFLPEQEEWFYERGCRWNKVCANPGDLILWDSRTMHFNCPPEASSKRARVVTYSCMAPAKLMSDEDRKTREYAQANYLATTHSPFNCHARPRRQVMRPESGKPDPLDTGIPRHPRPTTDVYLQLSGIKAY